MPTGPSARWLNRPTSASVAAALLAVLLLGAPVAVALGGSGYVLVVATRGAVLAIAAVSLQFMLGVAGLASLGQAAVVGIGAYAALLADGMDAAAIAPIGMAAAAAFAGLTGLLAVRTRGVTYIMITLAFGQMAYFVAQAWAPLGGDDGMALASPAPLWGTAMLQGRFGLYAAIAACLVAWLLLLRMLAASRFGRALLAVAHAPARAAALGFDAARLRLMASIIGGAGGGLSGFCLAQSTGFVSPAALEWRSSGHLLVMAILGGRFALGRSPETRLLGAALAAITLVAAEEWLATVTEHGALLLGPALLLAALWGRR